MNQRCIVLTAALLLAGPAFAGVVYEFEMKSHDETSPVVETTRMAVQGKRLSTEVVEADGDNKSTVIFHGDRREMVIVDHGDRSYFVMNEKQIKEIADKLGQVKQQMDQMLANVPEEQRPMIEKMMKARMPNMDTPAAPVVEVKKTGESAKKNDRACQKYVVLSDGRKIRELWVTDWNNVEGSDEVSGVFEQMAEFLQEMLDAFASAGGPVASTAGQVGDNFLVQMKDLDGFPVVSSEIGEDGTIEYESSLRSATERDLDPATFEPPEGYNLRSMTGER